MTEPFSKQQKENEIQLVSMSPQIRTVEEALEKAEVDLDIWEIDRSLINSWEMGAKLPSGRIAVTPLWQVKVWLKRKVEEKVEVAVEALLKRLPSYKVMKTKYPTTKSPHLLEIALFDVHFGKLAWAMETGQDYDLKIAEQVFHKAVDTLLNRASSFDIERILLPIGQDFFHIDNWQNATTAGTPQDTDGRWPKIFETGMLACIKAIDRLLQCAPVHILQVPGNHDFTTSWYLVKCLQAWYRNNPNVSFDASPRSRKYYEYGQSLIGFTHGSEEKQTSLPAIMASEVKHEWARTSHHEWHTGHLHIRRQTHFVSADTQESVIVRILPSLCGSDAWHYKHGYICLRAAEAYLFSKQEGYVGHFSANGP